MLSSISISSRIILSFFISFSIMLCCGNKFIKYLSKHQSKGQPIRDDGPQSHIANKQGTPTMGGILIILSILASCLLLGNLNSTLLILSLVVLVGFGLVGFIDDYNKVSKNDYHGISAKAKILLQFILAIVCCCIAYVYSNYNSNLYFPFIGKIFTIDLGYLFIPWAIFIVIGSSNAVNITDGLDGLAIFPITITALSFLLINSIQYCNQDLSIFLSAIIGSGLGFLWFNTSPAKVFMGDTGSISLGAVLGFIAVILKSEIVYAIIGSVFVIETLSVIMQVLYYKKTKKRIFLMAPLHHHFEKKGLKETTIVTRFWIVSIMSAIMGLLLYFINF